MIGLGLEHRVQPVDSRIDNLTSLIWVHADPSVDHVHVVLALVIHIVEFVTSFVEQDVVQMFEHLLADDLGSGDEHVIIDRVEQIDHISHERFNLIVSQSSAEGMSRCFVTSLDVDTGMS